MYGKLQAWKSLSCNQAIIAVWCAPAPIIFVASCVAIFVGSIWEESPSIVFVLVTLPMPLFAGIAGGILLFKSEMESFRRRSSAPPTARIAALSVGFAIAGTVASYVIFIAAGFLALILCLVIFEPPSA